MNKTKDWLLGEAFGVDPLNKSNIFTQQPTYIEKFESVVHTTSKGATVCKLRGWVHHILQSSAARWPRTLAIL